MKKFLLAFFALVSSVAMFAQGTTTGSMKGFIKGDNEPLIGANIAAVHTPTGSFFGASTDANGIFRISNMKVGGPYKVTVSYTGFTDQVYEGIIIRLGEAYDMNVTLQEGAIALGEIVVAAKAGTVGANSGTSTQISTAAIESMPTLNRDLSDYVRLTPQASGYNGGTSFGGINNRFNAIYIDGAVNNDVFGLSSQGTNGGQTGTSPFSIDIIDQIQVVLSPYDVSLGGFAGGGINAVTKSGTNDFKGTAYYFLQNQSMVGKTNKTITDLTMNDREKVADFTQSTYGASLGGPIVKDKVFFFTNVEIQKDETPTAFDFGTYDGDASEADLANLSTFLKNTYNYDPGTYSNVADELKGLKIFAKLDFNLNDANRLTLRHGYTKAENFDRNGSSSRTINFSNNGVYFPSVTNTSALELNSRFGSSMSNNLILGYTKVNDDRDPIGGNSPYVYIQDGAAQIRFGSEEFSTANALEQSIFTLTDNFKLYKGNHTFTIGTHNEFYQIYNLFVAQNYGTYRYDNLSQFLNQLPATEYDRSYSVLAGDITGDGSKAAADFKAMQLGFYAQDEFSVNSKLTVTGGIRLDVPILTTDPDIDPTFNTETIPLVRNSYPLAGNIEGGKAPSGQLMWSPRLGFSYDVTGDRKNVLRGGVGVFTSRIPFVWPGAMYNNNGLQIGRVDELTAGVPVVFQPDIQKQYTNANTSIPSGDINIFVKNFKYPQVFRTNLAFDTKLPGDISASFEATLSKTLNNVVYSNVNSDPTITKNWEGPDDRPVYNRKNLDTRYSAIYVGDNTSEGNAYNLTAAFAKSFGFGLAANLSYTYGDASSINDGTSSQNSSQWRGQVNYDGRNTPVYGRSDFALGHRVLAGLNYTLDWTGDKTMATTISVIYEGLKGSPYSYVIGGSGARNINNEAGSTSRNRSLIYIPQNQSDITLIEKNGLSPQAQWDLLNAFIEDDSYLSQNRGQYAEKNSNLMPYTGFLDLAVRQDLGVKAGGKVHKIQLSWDVFNLANLINPTWGVRYSVPGDFNNYTLYNFEGYDSANANRPTFSYTEADKGVDAFNISDFSSRWRMRLGLRYIFN